jgi:hypothetical protein
MYCIRQSHCGGFRAAILLTAASGLKHGHGIIDTVMIIRAIGRKQSQFTLQLLKHRADLRGIAGVIRSQLCGWSAVGALQRY